MCYMCQVMGMQLLPPSHCCEFCLRTNTNWHSLHIAQHRIDSNYFILVRCHFCISSQANANVLKCWKHSYWPCESNPIHIASYCIAERRINSCQFLLVRISSLFIHVASYCISLHRINSCLFRVWFANNHHIKSFWFGIKVDPVRTPNF